MSRRMMLRLALLGSLGVALAGPGGSFSAAGSARARLVAVVPGGIAAFAQDGARVVWLGCRLGSLDLRRAGAPLRTRPCTKDGRVAWLVYQGGQRLALANGWVLRTNGGGGNLWETIVTAQRLGSPDAIRLADAGSDYAVGDFAGPVAGDGKTLLYSTISVLGPMPDGCEERLGGCHRVLGSSGLWRVKDGVARQRAELPGGVALAVSGDFVAVAPAGGETPLPSSSQEGELGPCPCNFTPAVAPDGRLAFGSGRAGAGIALYVSDGSGSHARRITSPDSSALNPTWSPDGSRLAFERPGPAAWKGSIYVVGADGKGLRRLTTGAQPAWSPDGAHIAFNRNNTIYVIEPDGSNVQAIGSPFLDPTWSPDGKRLSYYNGAGVYVYDLASGVQTRLPDATRPGEWSPDGTAFLSNTYWNAEIWTNGIDGSNPLLIGHGYSPTWTSDSRHVVFSAPTGAGTVAPLELFKVGRDGGQPVQLTETTAAAAKAPVQVRRLSTGKLVASFVSGGDVQGLALSKRYVAAIIRRSAGARLEIRDARNGRLVRRVKAPGATPQALSITDGPRPLAVAGRRVAFVQGHRLRLLDIRTGKIRTAAIARGSVVGLDLQARRLTWAESPTVLHGDVVPRGNGRILTLALPAAR